MNVLVIIDPQIDFVEGTLPVPGAARAMAWLAQWIEAEAGLYDAVLVSMDQHPLGHCSFISAGGLWPSHCVRYSCGAAIYPPIMQALASVQEAGKAIYYIEKATRPEADSYSAFAEGVPEVIQQAERVYLAGLAGDYCVAESYADLIRCIAPERVHRLEEGIAWIHQPRDGAD